METPLQSISTSMLTPVYGQERSKAIAKYIQEFVPYASNFQPIVGAVREQRTAGLAGQQLLYLTCPLLVQCRDAGSTVLVVNVLFPVQFPDRAPFVLLVLPTNAHVKKDHSFIAQNGIIRLSMLPLLQNGPLPPYSICEILLAITDALENAYPFVANDVPAAGGYPTAPSHTPTSPVPSPSAPSVASEQQPVAKGSVVAPEPQQSHSPATPLPPPPAANVVRAAEALMLHLGKTSIEEYMATQQEVMALRGALKVDIAAMENEQLQLEKKAAALASLKAETDALRRLVEAEDAVPTESAKLLVPTDDTSSVALQLLSDIHAYDDAMQLEEQLLRKGIVSPDDYTKVISDLARAQFRSRYRYDRLLASLEPLDAAAHAVPPPPAPLVAAVTPAASPSAPAAVMQVPSPAAVEEGRKEPMSDAEAIRMLRGEFESMLDAGIIDDVWEATKSLATARMELRAMAGQ